MGHRVSVGVRVYRSAVIAPTLAEVRARSELLTERYPDPTGDAALQVVIDDAAALVALFTGRIIDPAAGEGLGGCPLEEVPAALAPLVVLAVTRKAESFPVLGSAEAREETIEREGGGLASFTAGPYGESYFAPGQAVREKTLDPDPTVNALLQALWTECMRMWWMTVWDPAFVNTIPASSISTFDWFPGGRLDGIESPCWPVFGDRFPDGF